jgi:hypothetical protein
MAQVYAVQPFTMEFCLDCHRSPAASLRSPSAVADMEWTPPGSAETLGARLQAERAVHPGTDCTTCHR